MTEKINELRDTLAQLHEQLENDAPVDAQARALLQKTMGEISEALERVDPESDAAPSEDGEAGLLDHLSQMAEDFEESHPAISAAVGRVATALSNLGI
ncbi:MAG: DUF4404 family protein [Deltaproteobacteria bacterium]|nr:DUF4404 family protein [Deltaproteobacteria bacterium]